MIETYSTDTCSTLEKIAREASLHRPVHIERYEPGTKLHYEITGIEKSENGDIQIEIEKFAGGGFAGQVYRVRLLDIEPRMERLTGLEKNHMYAMKIMIPPSSFAYFFRNLVYRIGFQGPFQLQVNPAAAREGALWQKFIRRAARIRFGTETVINDIHATFVDETLGSCGELSDWIDGRIWKLEVDDHMDLLNKYIHGKPVDETRLGSPEYRAKKQFMRELVKLLHDIGAPEFARQYEWSTCKSQPNCLKRTDSGDNPAEGLVAVDFRAGLALLPFLPMSPGDIRLIIQGMKRGSYVQFDRGNLETLAEFMHEHADIFSDMRDMFEELKTCHETHRTAVPDLTHNGIKLFYDTKLWKSILEGHRTAWKTQNLIDENMDIALKNSNAKTALFYVLGAMPLLGSFARKLCGRKDYRKHYGAILTSSDYFKRAFKTKRAEKILSWYRAGRMDADAAISVVDSIPRYVLHLLLSFLPVFLHRSFTSINYLKNKLWHMLVRPVKLYFNAGFREQWIREIIQEGQSSRMLDNTDAGTILSQLKEPYIQKYLKSLAVHVCTLPVTQIVSVLVSWIYVRMHPELTVAEATVAVAAILVLFQITPISPGSLTRGLYVVYLVIKERNFKDYNIAVFLGFFKYIGYLAFPIQMAYRYPELARFMAGHWATGAAHMVPVFGETGALLEHSVFGWFYNWPLTIRRKIRTRTEYRAQFPERYRHLSMYLIGALAAIMIFNMVVSGFNTEKELYSITELWWFAALVSVFCGSGITIGCGGASLSKRVIISAIWGIAAGVSYFLLLRFLYPASAGGIPELIWGMFIMAVFAPLGTIATELWLPETC